MVKTFVLSKQVSLENPSLIGYTLAIKRRFRGQRVVYSSGLETKFSPAKFGEIIAKLPHLNRPNRSDIIMTLPLSTRPVDGDYSRRGCETSLSVEELFDFCKAYTYRLNMEAQGVVCSYSTQT